MSAFEEKKSHAADAKKTRVCVVCGDYGESCSPLKEVDDIPRSPQLHCESCTDLEFDTLDLHKKDVYAKLRAAVTSGNFDVFFIMADGAMDEDRAGVEVVQTLENFGVAFTGARSAFYELTKPEMKVLALRYGIETARFAVVQQGDDFARAVAASRLSFPLIVKHLSGYSSVGMTKRNKVHTAEELAVCCKDFCATYQQALVEEFVTGLEVTVLACGDSTQPDGIRVYPPVFVSFPEGEDFKHFDIKWVSYDDMQWKQLPDDHPAMAEICRVTRIAFRSMMNGMGYGRVDLRIEAGSNRVVFLEINPNCGMMYPTGQEASADFILDLAAARSDFVRLQIREALAVRDATLPAYAVKLDGSRGQGWTTRATRFIAQGGAVLSLTGGTDVKLLAQQQQSGGGSQRGSCDGSDSIESCVSAAGGEDSGSSNRRRSPGSVTTNSNGSTATTTTTSNSLLIGHLLDPNSCLRDRGIATVAAVMPPTASAAAASSSSSSSVSSGPATTAASCGSLFSVALNDCRHALSHIVGAVPFPKANGAGAAAVGGSNKNVEGVVCEGEEEEVPNVALDVEGLRFVALRDIAAGEELLI